MKKFWLVLLSLGLIMAFSASAYAVDVKFSGSMYAAGVYLNRVSLDDTPGTDGQSTAFYFQRLRLTTEFVVSPGLSLITRADIMERVWGANRSTPDTSTALTSPSMGTKAENENIAFDYAYIQYATPIGLFRVGAMPGGAWGTVFGDVSGPAWRLWYLTPSFNGFQVNAIIQKDSEKSFNAVNTTSEQTDNDNDLYNLAFIYTAKSWNAGLNNYFYFYNSTRDTTATSYKRKSYKVVPYAKANIGPVAVQAELQYAFGKYKEYDNPGNTDQDVDSLSYFVDAVATFGQFYVGGTFAYAQGQGTDPNEKNDALNGGLDWSPALIMWSEDRAVWVGTVTSTAAGTNPAFGTGMSNAYFGQIRGGVKPTDKLDIMLAVSYATADTKPTNFVSKDYGWEVDVTGTYKITNNLSYMLGVGYLFTGDYFKGTSDANDVSNDYLVINKLALTF